MSYDIAKNATPACPTRSRTLPLFRPDSHRLVRRRFIGTVVLVAAIIGLGRPAAEAKPKGFNLDVIPTITNLEIANGQLLASGTATAVIQGKTYQAPFSGVPMTLRLAADQTGAGACPILDLELGPINLNLLGLVVQTSPICLELTAYENAGLLGDLLCAVANLLGGGLTLDQVLAGQGLVSPVVLPGLSATQVSGLLSTVTSLLNNALDNLLGAVLRTITIETGPRSCAILNLALGPVNLNLLGLTVALDNCANGPVTVDITAQRGALLGDLLCALLGRGGILSGATLADIINRLLPLL